jgi:hypothetical protein
MSITELGLKAANALSDALSGRTRSYMERQAEAISDLNRIGMEKSLAEKAQNDQARARVARHDAIASTDYDIEKPLYRRYGWVFDDVSQLRKLQFDTHKEAQKLKKDMVKTGVFTTQEVERLDLPHLQDLLRELEPRLQRARHFADVYAGGSIQTRERRAGRR